MSKLMLAVAAIVALIAVGASPQAALIIVVLAALLLACRGKRGAVVTGHAHGGTSKLIARHEAGHAAVARGLGGRVRSVRAWNGGGLTQVTLPDHDPVKAIAFLTGGRAAAGGWGCGGDDSAIRRELRGVPSKDRARVRREGQTLGRKLASRRSGQIRRDARTIERTGRL